ncbi:D-glycero-alpha-D-manno-heptose-1,7-bisphosphate 7-phosphatase [Thalassospira marina]|uniref:D,D-heptose 1,7-bisphosphate phosphatase n=1 Tax=Thalassospira marina TaxID=2048283 RepID=A0A2N3KS30_9PROT|nr:HAD family hydrolase [Thalassospira marina]AUG52493.1 D,D-heptose 1,7-bisphosphate phosphatase [Thalassospira marina]PKR53389.1 D,D-heptose 1,7-bisphosphate phosphatase [Thalassospira marina]
MTDYSFVRRHLIDPAPKWRDQRNPLPAVFLDRDGVINQEVHYLSKPEDMALIPGVGAAIARINAASVPVVVVTNQSGVARGFLGEDGLLVLHQRMTDLLAAEGASVQGIYYSPFHPDGQGEYRKESICRKPGPGMILAACEDFAIDRGESVLIGDKLADIGAGRAAGMKAVLVKTGHGAKESQLPGAQTADFIANDLADAIDRLFEMGVIAR